MLEYWLMPLVGFLMDTTLAASKLVFSGVVARHPRIRWVLTHMGGAIPYLAERLDRGYRAFAECRQHIDRAAERVPEAVLLRHGEFQPVGASGSRSISPVPIASSPAATIRTRSAASR